MNQHPVPFKEESITSKGKIKEYKKQLEEMSELDEANEPDTIDLQFSYNKFGTKCIINDTYSNPETVFAHFDGVASNTILPQIHDLFRITRLRFMWTINKKLRKEIDGLDTQTTIQFAGFTSLFRYCICGRFA
jgi:hypothetical protein